MNTVIFKKKLIKDLRGIHDVLMGQGDPILASMVNVAIECVEKQEAVPYSGTEATGDEPKKEKRILKAIKRFEQEYAAAKQRSMIHDPVAYALYQTWKAADEARL
jgi:hypothetical protein